MNYKLLVVILTPQGSSSELIESNYSGELDKMAAHLENESGYNGIWYYVTKLYRLGDVDTNKLELLTS